MKHETTRRRDDEQRASSHERAFVFYGGKGGVGKTTCAAARALAEAAASRRKAGIRKAAASVLVVSTDPAHSLGDALGVRLTSRPRRVAAGLDAVELDASRAFARWLGAHRRALGDILEHGTVLDGADVEALLDLTIPGIDELVGLVEIHRLAARYTRVIVDTAPTGHTLRLMSAPETVAAVAALLDALQAEHRVIRTQLARINRPEAADALVTLLANQAAEWSAILRDPRRTSFSWITLPEPLSIAEAGDGIAALERSGIRVRELIVNRVRLRGGPCPLCDPRREGERRALATIKKTIGRGRSIRVVPAAVAEPRGVPALRRFGESGEAVEPREPVEPRDPREPAEPCEPFLLDSLRDPRLLFVGGKGGVGKTTVAAAIALQLARRMPDASLLLLSTDPAHSLADVFDAAVDDTPRPIRRAPPNLFVRELDATRALAARREALQSTLDEIARSAAPGVSLLDLAPPGIDELFGMLEVIEQAVPARNPSSERRRFSHVIVDTAPTGHALRLLEMPDAAREWTQALLRMLLKYRAVVRPGPFAQELVDASRSIRALQALLRDPQQARFVVVTRAARVVRAETVRLLRRLRSLRLATPAVLVNALTLDPGACRWCRATAAVEQRELAALAGDAGPTARRRDCAIIQLPLVAPAPRGVEPLDRWAQRWIA